MAYYLYLKTHKLTGLKYLGKTERDDFHAYPGSGVYWKRHLNKHGYDYTTQCLLKTESQDELKQTGLFFSKLWNIVDSFEFANLTKEDGNGGGNLKHLPRTKEWKANISKSKTGDKNPMWKDGRSAIARLRPRKPKGETGMFGLSHTDDTKRKISQSLSMWMWITDGKTNQKVRRECNIPTGWSRGMTR